MKPPVAPDDVILSFYRQLNRDDKSYITLLLVDMLDCYPVPVKPGRPSPRPRALRSIPENVVLLSSKRRKYAQASGGAA